MAHTAGYTAGHAQVSSAQNVRRQAACSAHLNEARRAAKHATSACDEHERVRRQETRHAPPSNSVLKQMRTAPVSSVLDAFAVMTVPTWRAHAGYEKTTRNENDRVPVKRNESNRIVSRELVRA